MGLARLGREVSGLELDTTAGPAWKPLPVLTTTVLAPLGDAPASAPLLARAGGLLALAFRLAARLAGSRPLVRGAVRAALGLLATTGFLRGVAGGSSEESSSRSSCSPSTATSTAAAGRRSGSASPPPCSGPRCGRSSPYTQSGCGDATLARGCPSPPAWRSSRCSGWRLSSGARATSCAPRSAPDPEPRPARPRRPPGARGRQGVRHDGSAAGSAPGSGHDRARRRPARADPPCARRRLRSLGRPRRRDGPGRLLREDRYLLAAAAGLAVLGGIGAGRVYEAAAARAPRVMRRPPHCCSSPPSRPRSRQHAGSGASWPTRPSSAPTSPLRSSAPGPRPPAFLRSALRWALPLPARRLAPARPHLGARPRPEARASSSAPSSEPASRTARSCRPATSSWPAPGPAGVRRVRCGLRPRGVRRRCSACWPSRPSCARGHSTPHSGSTRGSRPGSPRTRPGRFPGCCARTARRPRTTSCSTRGRTSPGRARWRCARRPWSSRFSLSRRRSGPGAASSAGRPAGSAPRSRPFSPF